MAKFSKGDRVRLNPRVPANQDFDRYAMTRPRTVMAVRYSPQRKCCYYTLGSNSLGRFSMDGDPQLGYTGYEFRSYQLEPYQPRQYGRRRYRMKPTDSRLLSNSVLGKRPMSTDPLTNTPRLTCCRSREIAPNSAQHDRELAQELANILGVPIDVVRSDSTISVKPKKRRGKPWN